jgi:hypothetical protein
VLRRVFRTPERRSNRRVEKTAGATSQFVFLPNIYWGDQIKDDEILGGMQHAWKRYKMFTKFWLESQRRRHHLGDLGIDSNIILRWLFGKQGVSMAMNLRVPRRVENS